MLGVKSHFDARLKRVSCVRNPFEPQAKSRGGPLMRSSLQLALTMSRGPLFRRVMFATLDFLVTVKFGNLGPRHQSLKA